MKKIDKSSPFIVYNLRETYHELGVYEFKIVLNPRIFKGKYESELSFVDSDGKAMKFNVEKWGRKLNCEFIIDENVSDGVSYARIFVKNEKGVAVDDRISWWVIKP